jgi:hypothetical protein
MCILLRPACAGYRSPVLTGWKGSGSQVCCGSLTAGLLQAENRQSLRSTSLASHTKVLARFACGRCHIVMYNCEPLLTFFWQWGYFCHNSQSSRRGRVCICMLTTLTLPSQQPLSVIGLPFYRWDKWGPGHLSYYAWVNTEAEQKLDFDNDKLQSPLLFAQPCSPRYPLG